MPFSIGFVLPMDIEQWGILVATFLLLARKDSFPRIERHTLVGRIWVILRLDEDTLELPQLIQSPAIRPKIDELLSLLVLLDTHVLDRKESACGCLESIECI